MMEAYLRPIQVIEITWPSLLLKGLNAYLIRLLEVSNRSTIRLSGQDFSAVNARSQEEKHYLPILSDELGAQSAILYSDGGSILPQYY